MNQPAPKLIIVLSIGSAIGAAVVVFLALAATQLTFEQLQSLQRNLAFVITWAFIFWAILYAPLKARSLNKRIVKLESLIEKRSPSSE